MDGQKEFQFDGFEPANTTPVPDILFDELLTELSGPELKIVLYIIRRTLGFKKSSDGISLTQFTDGIKTKDGKILDKGCGIKKRSTVSKLLTGLIARRIVESEKSKTDVGDAAVTIYRIRFRGVVAKTALPSAKTATTVVDEMALGGSAKTATRGSAVLATHNKQITRNSNVQETERQEDTYSVSSANASDDTSPTRASFVHPIFSFLSFDDPIRPTTMIVELIPIDDPYWSEMEDDHRQRVAGELLYELEQKGHYIIMQKVYKPVTFDDVVEAPTLSSTPNVNNQSVNVDKSATIPQPVATGTVKENAAPAELPSKTSKQAAIHIADQETKKPRTTKKKVSLTDTTPVPKPEKPAEDALWTPLTCMMLADYYRGSTLAESERKDSKYQKAVRGAIKLVNQQRKTYQEVDRVFRFMKCLDKSEPDGIWDEWWDGKDVDLWNVGDHCEGKLKEIERKQKGKAQLKTQQSNGNGETPSQTKAATPGSQATVDAIVAAQQAQFEAFLREEAMAGG